MLILNSIIAKLSGRPTRSLLLFRSAQQFGAFLSNYYWAIHSKIYMAVYNTLNNVVSLMISFQMIC